MKLRFDQIFNVNPDGSLRAKVDLKFNGDRRKAGTTILPAGGLGRMDLRKHIGHDVEVEANEEGAVIMGFYP